MPRVEATTHARYNAVIYVIHVIYTLYIRYIYVIYTLYIRHICVIYMLYMQALKASPCIADSILEGEKFVLLPDDSDRLRLHDEPIFVCRPVEVPPCLALI